MEMKKTGGSPPTLDYTPSEVPPEWKLTVFTQILHITHSKH